MSIETEKILCKLFKLTDGSCVDTLNEGDNGELDVEYCNTPEHNQPIVQFDKTLYSLEEHPNGTVFCTLWEKSSYSAHSLILPVIVFALLCVLLFIMIYQSV